MSLTRGTEGNGSTCDLVSKHRERLTHEQQPRPFSARARAHLQAEAQQRSRMRSCSRSCASRRSQKGSSDGEGAAAAPSNFRPSRRRSSTSKHVEPRNPWDLGVPRSGEASKPIGRRRGPPLMRRASPMGFEASPMGFEGRRPKKGAGDVTKLTLFFVRLTQRGWYTQT